MATASLTSTSDGKYTRSYIDARGSYEIIHHGQFITMSQFCFSKGSFDYTSLPVEILQGLASDEYMEAFREGAQHLSQYQKRVSSITSIPVRKLIHVTHYDAAQAIKNDGSTYTFNPLVKQGKGYDPGSCVPDQGGILFDKVDKTVCVFCEKSGCNHKFSWWGVDISDWYKEGGRGAQFGNAVDLLDKQRIYAYVPDFLKYPPESTYGTQGFSMKLSTLIRRYRNSRDDSNDKVCFRIGGTFEYTQEIAYVVIVCMGNELNDADYPRMNNNVTAIFQHNGLLNDLGEVEHRTKIPEFKLTHLIMNKFTPPSGRRTNAVTKKFNWQNLVFAFYLPNGDLKCKEKDLTGDVCSIPHFLDTCHSRLGSGKVCPDFDKSKDDSRFSMLQFCKKHTKFFCPKCDVEELLTDKLKRVSIK